MPDKGPIFRVRFESFDDFLVEYGERLRRGYLGLPVGADLGGATKVRIKLELPDGAVLYLKGSTEAAHGETVSVPMSEGVLVRLSSFTDDQRQRLEGCVKSAMSQKSGAHPMPEKAPDRNINLLLVDDSVSIRLELGDALRARGIRVRVAENGLVAIAAALKKPPEVILSDVEMPVMDGWTFLRMARARDRLAHIPFVFFTRLNDDLSRLQGYRMGVDDYLPKETHPDEIVARIEGILTRRGRRLSAAPDVGQGLRGELRHVRLGSLMSFLEAEQRTGFLHLSHGTEKSVMHILNGRLASVENTGRFQHDQDRVFEMLEWTLGEFEFVATEEEDVKLREDEKLTPLTYLLMEHARRSDEGERSDDERLGDIFG